MKTRISDMMDYLEEVSVNLRETEVASIDNIKEVTMQKIKTETVTHKTRKNSKMGMIVAALAATLLLAGTVAAHSNWDGFAYISELSKAEKKALSQENSVSMTSVDPDGNVHYLNAKGEEIMVLSKEEAAQYAQNQEAERAQRIQESTQLIDIATLPLIPTGITEMITNNKGQFADFALGSGYMVLLRPEEESGYSLKKEDTVTIALNDEEECILEFGLIKDGAVIESETTKQQNHSFSFEIKEDGTYNFYIMYYSANKGIFTDCVLTVR